MLKTLLKTLTVAIKLQCSKAKEQNFQFWKHLASELDINIKCVYKVHKGTCYASPKLIKCHVMSH